nr:glycoside-pentoside-hexuronide (GPH):cation symporter [Enterococcus villorum]
MDITQEQMNQPEKKMPLFRKLAYALPDTGGQLIMTTVGAYMLYFFTDVAKINIGQAGNLMLIAKIVAAIVAPISGILIDRTRSRYGKARPWYLWMCFPYALCGILSFVVPNFSGSWAMVYMWGTYILLNTVFVFINTPTTAILPLLTDDLDERAQVNSIRNGGSQIGALIANAGVLPMVAFFGHGNDQKGFLLMMIVMASICTICMLGAFGGLSEQANLNSLEQTEKTRSLKEQLSALKGNTPFVVIVVAVLLLFIAITIRNTSVIYYFTYNLENKGVTSLVNGLNSTQFITIALLPLIVKRMGTVNAWLIGIALTMIAQILLQVTSGNMMLVLFFWIISNFGFGISIPMCFTMLAETADFGE